MPVDKPKLAANLELPRCPHCSIASPNLEKKQELSSTDHAGGRVRRWRMYVCRSCGGVVTAASHAWDQPVQEFYPEMRAVDTAVPEKARSLLKQALESLHAPAGAVMLAASSVDAMLKEKEYAEGSLYPRIDRAVANGVITDGMGKWAHKVRLDANEQRHADVMAAIPTSDEAEQAVEFAMALGQFLFVLPSQVEEGLEKAKSGDSGGK